MLAARARSRLVGQRICWDPFTFYGCYSIAATPQYYSPGAETLPGSWYWGLDSSSLWAIVPFALPDELKVQVPVCSDTSEGYFVWFYINPHWLFNKAIQYPVWDSPNAANPELSTKKILISAHDMFSVLLHRTADKTGLCKSQRVRKKKNDHLTNSTLLHQL